MDEEDDAFIASTGGGRKVRFIVGRDFGVIIGYEVRVTIVEGSEDREWYRIVDARKQLRTAHDLFSDFGMEALPSAHASNWKRPASMLGGGPSTALDN